MAIQWLESFDAIDTSLFGAKGWVATGAPTVSTTTPRTGAQCLDCGAAGRYVSKAVPTPGATMYLGFAFRTASLATYSGASPISQSLCGFASVAGTNTHLTLEVTTTGGLLVYRHEPYYNDSGRAYTAASDYGTTTNADGERATIGSAGSVISTNTWYYVEMKVVIHQTTGSVEVRLNGVTVINVTGVDTRCGTLTGGTATVDTIHLGKGYGPTAYQGFDDVYVSDSEFLGDIGVHCLLPTGNGFHSELLGSDGNSTDNYALVDEAPGATADYVGSSTDNQKDTYIFSNLAPAAGTVKGVQLSALAMKTDAGSRSIRLLDRYGGVDGASPDVPLSTTWTYASVIEELSQATFSAWTKDEIDNTEFGVQIRP